MADIVATERTSSSGWAERVERALDVRTDETGLVAWTCGLFFAMLASGSIGLNVADALFFLRFGVDQLPLMIMASGFAVMVVTIVYAAGLGALGARRWSWMMPAAFAGWLFVERIGVSLDVAGIYPAIWLTGQVIIYVSFTLLWDVAGGLANAQQAKRLFPLFTSAGIAGAVVGNGLTGPLANLVGTENLLLVQAATMSVAGFFAYSTARRFLGRSKRGARMIISDLRSGLTTTLQIPLFRLVAGVGALISVLFFLVFMPFSTEAAASFQSEAALAGFLGFFSSMATAATFLVSLLFANRLFTRIGVVAVLMVVAVVYVAGFATWLVSFGLVTATLFRGLQWVVVNALGNTAFSSLFNVLTGESRSQVRDFVNAVPMQLGTIAAGAILLLSANLSNRSMTILSLAIAVTFLMLVLPMRRAYAAALVDGLRKGLSGIFTAELRGLQKPHCDADTLAALASGLKDPEPARRRVAATILADVGGAPARDALLECLDDPDASVRLVSLEGLERIDRHATVVAAPRLLADPDPRIRRVALDLVEMTPDVTSIVMPMLEDDDPYVRASAARRIGGSDARATITAMLAASDDREIEAAMLAVTVDRDLLDLAIADRVRHPSRRVRAAAAAVAGSDGDVDTLLTLIDDESALVRLAAANALVTCDEGQPAIRDIVVRGSVNAREAALHALVSRPGNEDFLREWASDEIDRAASLHAYREALEAARESEGRAAHYLIRVLEMRERMVQRWVVTALSSDNTRGALELVSRGAISGDSDVQAAALEALESIADRQLANRFAELLDEARHAPPGNHRDALRALAEDSQVWFRALALRALDEELSSESARVQRQAATDTSPLVQGAVGGQRDALPPPAATTIDIVLDLQRAALFGALDPETLEAIVPCAVEISATAGRVMLEEGTASDALLLVCDGSVEVRLATAENTLAHLGAGELVGELGVLRQQPRMAQVVAGPDGLRALQFEGDVFRQLVEDHRALATALLSTLAERIAAFVET
ncbi:MAG: cyclic nucleotide-binding domain-containing protein [Acidimicrobiia bacterium]|nr:cyclic nucleotide-binding domain-containing protein [Acidimicrobiia bacterium]